jgi:membrane-bound lytic murein transglycosylase MltF
VKRLAIFAFAILTFLCACGNGRKSSAEKSANREQISQPQTEFPADKQENINKDALLDGEAEKKSTPEYMEMPRPGVISRYDKMVRKYARRYLFDWRLISAQIYAESRFCHQAQSYCGALGLMQIMPGTARWLEKKSQSNAPELKNASKMLLKPETNIHLGCYYDRMLFGGSKGVSNSNLRYKMMFAAYNAGPGNLNRARRKSDEPESWEEINRHLPEETRNYIPTIYDKYGVYKRWAVLKPY